MLGKKRKVFSSRLDEKTVKDLKYLAIDLDRTLEGLLREAVEDLVQKYQKRGRRRKDIEL